MGNPYNDIRELQARMEALETRLDEHVTLLEKFRHGVYYRIRTVRDMVIRIQSLDPQEIQYVGHEHSLGSRLILPGRPRRLRERMAVEKIPRVGRKDLSMLQVKKALDEEIDSNVVRRRTKRVHRAQ